MEINTKYLKFFGNLKKRSKKPTAVVVHHTCTKTPEKTRSALKEKGCSTHYEIDRDGTIYQYVDPMQIASHCGSANIHTIGIDITHVKDGKWTDEQYVSANWLAHYLHDKYGIKLEVHEALEGFWPHKALGNTVCPQDFDLHKMVPEEPKEEPEPVIDDDEEDFDVVKRIVQLIGVAFVDGRRDELRGAIESHFPSLL